MRSALIVSAVCAALSIGACNSGDGASEGASGAGASAPSTIPQPTRAQLVAAGLEKLSVAPESKRLDITAPTFSDPTQITNPLFPVSRLSSAIFSGTVDGKPFHTETTLLPETRTIEWSPGQQVEARVSQYFAFLDGRIEEVALDYYARRSQGGRRAQGREHPGDRLRGGRDQDHRQDPRRPGGPVKGGMVARELHDDGTYSDKVFAPGYGEFYSAHEGDTEAMALAVPTDSLKGSPPAALEALSRAAHDVIDPARSGNWKAASTGSRAASRAWAAYQREQVPPRLAAEITAHSRG